MIIIILLFLGVISIGLIDENIKMSYERKTEYEELKKELNKFVEELDEKTRQEVIDELNFQKDLNQKELLSKNFTVVGKDKTIKKVDIYKYLLSKFK